MYIRGMEANLDIVVAVILGVILLSALGLSLTPVRLRILLSTDAKRLRVSFWKLTIVDSDSPAKVSKGKSQEEKKETADKGSGKSRADTFSERLSRFVKYVEVAPKIAKAALRFVMGLLGKLKLRDVSGSVSGGLADPADTGMAFGALYAILGASPGLQSHLIVKPNYQAERIAYSFQGEIALRPLALLGPTFRLLHELPKRELFRIVRKLRKCRKAAKSGE